MLRMFLFWNVVMNVVAVYVVIPVYVFMKVVAVYVVITLIPPLHG